MRTLFVNGLTVLAFSSFAASACSKADARNPNGSTTKPPVDSLVAKADLGRIDGSPSAKVWVVEVSDMQCPFCQEWHDRTFPVVRDEFIKTGKIRFAYVNLPLRQHKNAQAAANAAMCVSAQGKFWEMHDALFSTQKQWDTMPDPSAHFKSLASKNGADTTAWKSCVSSKVMQPLIDGDVDRANKAGVASTPSFIIGGKLLEGAVGAADMRKAIKAALAVAK